MYMYEGAHTLAYSGRGTFKTFSASRHQLCRKTVLSDEAAMGCDEHESSRARAGMSPERSLLNILWLELGQFFAPHQNASRQTAMKISSPTANWNHCRYERE